MNSARAGDARVTRTQVLPVASGGWSAFEPGRRRAAAGVIGLALLAGGLWYLLQLALDPLRSSVDQVDVQGTLDYADRDTLRDRVEPHLLAGFYRLDIDAMRNDLLAMPWISEVQVRRVWPASLVIDVAEHTPAARWNDAALIAADLTLFRPPQLQRDDPRHGEWQAHLAGLPTLRGSDGRHAELLALFGRYARDLSSLDLTLRELREDDRLSQTLILDDGTTVHLGYEERAMRFRRFVEVYPRVDRQLARSSEQQPPRLPVAGPARAAAQASGTAPRAKSGARGATFDMRYSNGFALSGAGTPLQDS